MQKESSPRTTSVTGQAPMQPVVVGKCCCGALLEQGSQDPVATGDLTIRIGVKDRIANCYHRNMFGLLGPESGALSNHDWIP